MSNWKSLIIQKGIMKPSGKILCICAKNQLKFEFFEKILKFSYANFNGNRFFPIFYQIFQNLSFYTAVQNSTIFLEQFFPFGGRESLSFPSPAPLKYIAWNIRYLDNANIFHNCLFNCNCWSTGNVIHKYHSSSISLFKRTHRNFERQYLPSSSLHFQLPSRSRAFSFKQFVIL